MTSTSRSLLDRVKNSDPSGGWSELSRIYQPLIRSWLQRLAAPASDVDDLVQEVLMVVIKKLPSFEHNNRPGAFRTWLRGISVNCLRDLWRSNRLTPSPGHDSSFQEALTQLEDQKSELTSQWDREHDQHVTHALLRQIRKDFDEQSWRAFELVVMDELPAGKVAERMGMTRNAVYAVKSRVMSRLREQSKGILE